jgi:hypothetical protein
MDELDINKKFINLKQRFPWTFQDILQFSKINEWLKAIQREYDSIIENKMYIFVNLSKGRKIIKNK